MLIKLTHYTMCLCYLITWHLLAFCTAVVNSLHFLPHFSATGTQLGQARPGLSIQPHPSHSGHRTTLNGQLTFASPVAFLLART